MLPVIQLGPLAIRTPGLLILAGIWIGLTVAEKLAPRFNLKPEFIYNGVGITLIAGLLGSRLSYIFLHFSAFIDDPWAALSLDTRLLDPWGGIVTGALVLLIYLQRQQLSVLNYLDALTPLLAVMQIALPAANLASGSGYGIPTLLPWSIELWGALRHPTQVYDILAGIGILGFVIFASQNAANRQPARLFLMFIALSAGARIFLEGFRADRFLVLSRFRFSQIAAWIALLIALVLLGVQNNRTPYPTKSPVEN